MNLQISARPWKAAGSQGPEAEASAEGVCLAGSQVTARHRPPRWSSGASRACLAGSAEPSTSLLAPAHRPVEKGRPEKALPGPWRRRVPPPSPPTSCKPAEVSSLPPVTPSYFSGEYLNHKGF